MAGVGELARIAYYQGYSGRDLMPLPLAWYPGARPRLGPTDIGLIFDCATNQILDWQGAYWTKGKTNEAVDTAPFSQVRPTFVGEPKAGSSVKCLPGTWAGSPAPTLRYVWTIDGKALGITKAAPFDTLGNNAEELALLTQGRLVGCTVYATNTLRDPAGPSYPYTASADVSGYLKPA